MGRDAGPEARAIVEAQLNEARAWLLGPEGRARARRTLTSRGLPRSSMDVDDLTAAALERIVVRLARGGPIELQRGDDSMRAYATTVLRSVAARLDARGGSGRFEELVDWSDERAPVVDGGDDPAQSGREAASLGRGVRRLAIHAIDGRVQAWTVAAALASLTIGEGVEPRRDDIRPPANGQHLPLWAGLVYAGRTDCFDEPEDGAVRERRSQALQRVTELLRRLLDESRQDLA